MVFGKCECQGCVLAMESRFGIHSGDRRAETGLTKQAQQTLTLEEALPQA